MDALTNLKDHCPDWARRLDELSGQIEQRQLDLAALAQQQQQNPGRSPNGRAGSRKSLRNRGSTESLRPNDEGEFSSPVTDTPGRTNPVYNKNAAHEARRASVASRGGVDKSHKSSGNGNGIANVNGNGFNYPSSTASERQANQVVAVASARARMTLRRTQLSRRRAAAAESLLSADGATPSRYRSRNLVVVYYDSYVQSFFEDLVKFVSASRNLMRKARMAAKVAQIKRMAELEVPDDDDDDDDKDSSAAEPRLDVEGPARTVPLQLAPVALRPDTSIHGLGNSNGRGKEDGAVEKRETKAASSDEKRDEGNGNGVPPAPNLTGQPYARISLYGNGTGNSNTHKPSSPTPRPTRPGMAGGYTSFSSLSFGFGGSHQPDIFDELDKVLEFVQSMCEHAAHQFLRDGGCADEIIKIRDRLNETREAADREMERMLQHDRTHNDGALPKAEGEVEAVQSRSLRPQIPRRDTLGSSIPTGEAEEPAAEKVEKQVAGPDGPLEVDDRATKDPPKFQYDSTRAMGRREMGP